ncbi:Aromatic-ring hydroxylase-like [Penicillium camemberti]|uniref:Aromatic-ring hydroxylase-like n=1 Tax=Penicillium camemberti (strain FM 013) TaxID=1429867 RepID=A0A0G4PIZ8_PENC3|nr:Aromatic-ring hydroxylase-like [Penicillium camemberti]
MTVTKALELLPESIPVLIVGAGPIGLSLAIELRLHGIEVAVIEKDLEIVEGHPKGRSNDLRTLEHYRRWGVSDKLRKLSWQPANSKQRLVITESLIQKPLGSFPLFYGRDAGESNDLAAEPSFSVPQPITMRLLQARALELGASIFRGWKVLSVRQDEDRVIAEIQSPDGKVHSTTSAYAVGCDGPGSLVRKSAGIQQKGVEPIGRTLSFVVQAEGHRISDLISSPAHDALGMLFVLSPRVSSIISIPGKDDWGYSITVPDGKILTEEEIFRSSYKVFTRVSELYQKGRLLIAGDASHLCPPTGGHNMNVGIGDAVNLGWKIAAVLKGWGGQKLLESYDIERRPVGERVSDAAMKNSYDLKKVAEIFEELPSLEDASEEERLRRGQLAYDLTYPEWNIVGVALDQRYDTSPIIVRDNHPSAPYDGTKVWPHATPGHRAPHVWLPDGSPLLDHLGKEFTLLDVEAVEGNVQEILAAADRAGLPLKRLQLSAVVARAKYAAEITIIRPDQYISWQGSKMNDPALLVDIIRGV